MPNFEFSDTSTFNSDDTLSMKDFQGGGGKMVSGVWKLTCWILIVTLVLVVAGCGWMIWSRNAVIKALEETKSSSDTDTGVENLIAHVTKMKADNTEAVALNTNDLLKKWIEDNHKSAPSSS